MEKRTRGRPRQYDRDAVLGSAVDLFSTQGFDATSLDDLSAAMSMTRPSIYNAFGDKESVYLAALDHFVEGMRLATAKVLSTESDLATALTKAYHGALDVYFLNDPARGCFVFCTAPVEALTHASIQRRMNDVLGEIDALFEGKFREAQKSGQFPSDASPKSAAKLAHAVLHSLAIRSRAGESKRSLHQMVKYSVGQLVNAG
jgi:AcrR family transcriptional regulator